MKRIFKELIEMNGLLMGPPNPTCDEPRANRECGMRICICNQKGICRHDIYLEAIKGKTYDESGKRIIKTRGDESHV